MFSNINWSDYIVQTLAGLTIVAITALIGYLTSARFRNWLTVTVDYMTRWLARYWPYVVVGGLLFISEYMLYRLYDDWKLIAYSILDIAFTISAVWLLAFTSKKSATLFDYKPHTLLHGWKAPSNWIPRITARGLELVSHNGMSKVLLLEDLPRFTNGVIECEVYLESGALFDVLLRGDLESNEFYMARFDSRTSLWDCILVQPKSGVWHPCNETNRLTYHSPHNRWLTMRVIADGQAISLFRDGTLIDWIDDAPIKAGRIGLLAEVANVYVRRVSIIL